MISEAMDRVIELAAPNIKDFSGLVYTDKPLTLIAPPLPPKVEVVTLTGFADAIAALAVADALLIVDSPVSVQCVSIQSDAYGRRQVYVTAKHDHQAFGFGRYVTPEEMVIGLRSKFVYGQADDLDYVCKMVGNITNEGVVKTEDDGVTQAVAVRRGIAIRGAETLKPIVNLTPWRAFTEVRQATSPFLFRAKSQGSETLLALIEADGGEWKVQAAESIAQWLNSNPATSALTVVR